MAGKTRWIVTLNSDGSRDAVRSRLEAAGFTVEEDLTEIGVVVGQADDDAAAAVRNMKEVEDVAPELGVDVGPPDAPGTW